MLAMTTNGKKEILLAANVSTDAWRKRRRHARELYPYGDFATTSENDLAVAEEFHRLFLDHARLSQLLIGGQLGDLRAQPPESFHLGIGELGVGQ
jgi:hypothetical protein